jgi:hypothetical protein
MAHLLDGLDTGQFDFALNTVPSFSVAALKNASEHAPPPCKSCTVTGNVNEPFGVTTLAPFLSPALCLERRRSASP